MIQTSMSIDIDASPAAVWAELARLDHHTAWMTDAIAIAFRTEQRTGVGTVMECKTRIGPFTTNDIITVTGWDEGKQIDVSHDGLVHGEGSFIISDGRSPMTATVTWVERLRLPLVFGGRLGEVVARPLLRRIWLGDLRNLKRECEHPSS